jgi:hypothetical protein
MTLGQRRRNMEAAENNAGGNAPGRAAAHDLAAAEVELEEARRDVETDPEKAVKEIEIAERHLDKAKAEIREEQPDGHLVEVTVDRVPKKVPAGIYVVSVFKEKVGVAADRELDEIKDGVLVPLADTATIKIHGHEVFVSHPRTGGSS